MTERSELRAHGAVFRPLSESPPVLPTMRGWITMALPAQCAAGAAMEKSVAHADSSPSAMEAEAAIVRVLDAERRGRATLEEARGRAAARVEQARAQAIEVTNRAERRNRAIQVAFERRVEASQQAVDAEIAALAEAAAEAEDAAVRRQALDAVRRLAADLTEGGDD